MTTLGMVVRQLRRISQMNTELMYLVVIARILIGGFYMAGAVVDVLQRNDCLQLMEFKKIPYQPWLFAGEVVLKFLAGLAIVINFYTVINAIALIIFTLIANIIFNNFWKETGKKAQLTFVRFWSYVAIMGGLLLLIAIYF